VQSKSNSQNGSRKNSNAGNNGKGVDIVAAVAPVVAEVKVSSRKVSVDLTIAQPASKNSAPQATKPVQQVVAQVQKQIDVDTTTQRRAS